MTLLKRIPVTLTLEVSSVEIMLADLLNIDDDTVIELDKLAGEPLDIKVNNILLGKAEVVVVNEKYGLRVLEFNTRDINDWHHETPHSTDAGLGCWRLRRWRWPVAAILRCLTWSPTATLRSTASKSGADSDDPRRFAAYDGADDDLLLRALLSCCRCCAVR